jgi:hypothetical protein
MEMKPRSNIFCIKYDWLKTWAPMKSCIMSFSVALNLCL